MNLYNQQKLMIRLCLENDFRRIFFGSTSLSKSFLEASGILHGQLDISGINHQAEAIYILLLNDLKANLERLKLKPKDFDVYYGRYINIFPYRLENKFEDHIRFLGFLLYDLLLDKYNKKVIDRIKFEYSVFASTLKRERLIDVITTEAKSKKTKTAAINPSLVLLSTRLKKKEKYLAFYYKGLETEITIIEVNKNLYEFLSAQHIGMTRKFIISHLSLKNPNDLKKLYETGLLYYISK